MTPKKTLQIEELEIRKENIDGEQWYSCTIKAFGHEANALSRQRRQALALALMDLTQMLMHEVHEYPESE